MASSVMQRLWNPEEVFSLNPKLSCPAIAHTKADSTCTRCRAEAAREEGRKILNEIAHFDPRSEALNIVLRLPELASCLLCTTRYKNQTKRHSDQANKIVSKWIHKMIAAQDGPNPARQIPRIPSANQDATELTALIDLQIATLRADHITEITTLRADHTTEIATLRADHNTEVAALNAQILELQSQNTRLSEANTTLEAQFAETSTTLETQLADTRTTLEAQLVETRTTLETQLVETNNKLETQLVEAKTEVTLYNVSSVSYSFSH